MTGADLWFDGPSPSRLSLLSDHPEADDGWQGAESGETLKSGGGTSPWLPPLLSDHPEADGGCREANPAAARDRNNASNTLFSCVGNWRKAHTGLHLGPGCKEFGHEAAAARFGGGGLLVAAVQQCSDAAAQDGHLVSDHLLSSCRLRLAYLSGV